MAMARSRPSHVAAALRPRHREGRRDSDARRRAAARRRLPAEIRRALPGHRQSQRLHEGQAVGPAARPGGEAQPLHELGDAQPAVVGAARLRAAAHRRARLGQVARAHRSVVRFGVARLLRRHRVGRTAALEHRPCRIERHLLFRDGAVAGGEPEAAVAEGDDPVGRRRRHVPRFRLPRRHLLVRLRHQLVQQPHGAPPARQAAGDRARRVLQALGVGIHAPQPGQRLVPRPSRGLGQDRRSALQRGQLERHGPAPARQYRGVHARGLPAQEAAHPRRHPLPPVLFRGRAHRPAALSRLLAEGHRHRDHARAAGEAPDPQGRARQLRVAQ